jgi:cell division protein FtsQ
MNDKKKRRRFVNTIISRILFFFVLFCFALVVYLLSPLSKIASVSILGNYYYEEDEIIAASKLTLGQSIWFLDIEKVSNRILDSVEVQSVTIERDFFRNEISIHFVEFKKVAFVVQDANYYPVMSQGNVEWEKPVSAFEVEGPLLSNFEDTEKIAVLIQELNQLPDEVLGAISEIMFDPSISNSNRIYLYMNDGFHVRGTITSFSDRMKHYASIVSQIPQDKKGIIDLEVGSYFEEFGSGGGVSE